MNVSLPPLDGALVNMLMDYGQMCVVEWYRRASAAGAASVAPRQVAAELMHAQGGPLAQLQAYIAAYAQEAVMPTHMAWARRVVELERSTSGLQHELREFGKRMGRAPGSAQVGLLQSMAEDVEHAEYGAASVSAAFAATEPNSRFTDLQLLAHGPGGATRRLLGDGGPVQHPKFGPRVRQMVFQGRVRMPPEPPRWEHHAKHAMDTPTAAEMAAKALALRQGPIPLCKLLEDVPCTIKVRVRRAGCARHRSKELWRPPSLP